MKFVVLFRDSGGFRCAEWTSTLEQARWVKQNLKSQGIDAKIYELREVD